jgi:hypothetical protein
MAALRGQLQMLSMIDISVRPLGWIEEQLQRDQMGDRSDSSAHLHPISMLPFGCDLGGNRGADDRHTDDLLHGEIEPVTVDCRERASHIRSDKSDGSTNIGQL